MHSSDVAFLSRLSESYVRSTHSMVQDELTTYLILVAALIARTLDMVSMPGHASAITAYVTALAYTEQLSSLDARMHAKYADHFLADIPPVNDIPANIYHCIYLKDVNQTIVTHSYNCPRKYQDAWCTLLS